MSSPNQSQTAALACLIVLQSVMLASLFAGVAPHPPATTPLFGIGPFLGASLSAAIAALVIDPGSARSGRILSGVAAVAGLVSFGPQKFLDPQFPLIWPAVLAGQLAAGVILFHLIARRGASGEERTRIG